LLLLIGRSWLVGLSGPLIFIIRCLPCRACARSGEEDPTLNGRDRTAATSLGVSKIMKTHLLNYVLLFCFPHNISAWAISQISQNESHEHVWGSKNKLLILSVCYFFLPLGIVPLTTVTRSTPCVAMFDRFWPRFQVARPRTKRQIGHFEVQHDAIAQKMQNALKMHSKCIKWKKTDISKCFFSEDTSK
jgi:hypothetical protein